MALMSRFIIKYGYVCTLAIIMLLATTATRADFVDNLDGTITDTSTNLIWNYSASQVVNWNGAQNYLSTLNANKVKNWRLPTSIEFDSFSPQVIELYNSNLNSTYTFERVWLQYNYPQGFSKHQCSLYKF